NRSAIGFVPPPLSALENGWVSTLFVHERTTPSGRKRLVVLFFQLQGRNGRELFLYGSGKIPATLVPGTALEGNPSHCGSLDLRQEDRLHIFWGQSDPDHGDHFTIGYELNDQRGTIDGWLKDDGQLDLRVRDGPATRRAATVPY